MLLYACKTWLVTDAITRRLQGFVNRKLRIIREDFWPRRMTTEELLQSCSQIKIADEIKKRKYGWIGHTLRKPEVKTYKYALEWNPQGRRKPGRPKTTWRRTIKSELAEKDVTWEDLKRSAPNRQRYKSLSSALYS